MTKPILLTKNQLLEPVIQAESRLEEISRQINVTEQTEIALHGMFVLAVSSFECMMSDIMLIMLRSFPEKLPQNQNIKKEVLLDSADIDELFSIIAEKEIRDASYKNIGEYMKYFSDVIGMFTKPEIERVNQLCEIKETRNLLVHNNLRINEAYKNKAGPNQRKPKSGEILPINVAYFISTIDCINYFITAIKDQINEKYQNYTKLKILKETWAYIFKSPVMRFEDYWEVDEDKDSVVCMVRTEEKRRLSSSEMTKLELWRHLFSGSAREFKEFRYASLDEIRANQIRLILKVYDFCGVE